MPQPISEPLDLRNALVQGIHFLRQARIPSETLAAELLLLHASGRDRTSLYAHPEDVLPPSIIENYFALIRRRAAGEPTQHLTGKQEFWGLEFEVNPDVLIPRPETEHLIEVALDRLAVRDLREGCPSRLTGGGLTIVDVGTGSGCLAIALAKELPAATIFATDISEPALKVARRNAARHNVSNHLQFLASNLLDVFRVSTQPSPEPERRDAAPHLGRIDHSVISSRQSPLLSPLGTHHSPLPLDLVISNPPYVARRDSTSLPVEVREHEPPVALYGGEEGYALYGPLILQAAQHLKPGGLLVLELGYDSLSAVRPLLEAPQWTNVLITNDLASIPRVLSAERSA